MMAPFVLVIALMVAVVQMLLCFRVKSLRVKLLPLILLLAGDGVCGKEKDGEDVTCADGAVGCIYTFGAKILRRASLAQGDNSFAVRICLVHGYIAFRTIDDCAYVM